MLGRLTYANVMATVAVFVALGGSSYAAISLKANSVKSKHIANGQVKSRDVANGSLLAADFRSGELASASAGPQGPQGEAGPEGPASPKGQRGEPGLSGIETVMDVSKSDSEAVKYAIATCPAGKQMISISGVVQPVVGTEAAVALRGTVLTDPTHGYAVAREVGAGRQTAGASPPRRSARR